MSIIAYIVMFCWYMSCVGNSRTPLKEIGQDKWWNMFIVFPISFTCSFAKGLVMSIVHGMKLAIEPLDKNNNKEGEGK